MPVINSQDIIDDGILKKFAEVTDSTKDWLAALNQIIASGKEFSAGLNNQSEGTEGLRKKTKDLSDEQRALNQIQNQIAIANGKLSDEYIKQQTILKDLQEKQKLKVALGEKEAINITQLNSSHTQLGIALNANVKAYSNLTNELQRQTPQGQQLLKVIQEQREAFNKQSIIMGETKVLVGGYTEAIEKAIPALAALNPKVVEAGEVVAAFGKKALALLFHPVVLAIAALIAAFTILKKSYDAFTDGTVKGADQAESFGVAWNTAIELVDAKMKLLGETISDALQKSGISEFFTKSLVFAIGGAVALAEYNVRLERNIKILELQQEIRKEEIVLSVESARIALEKEEELTAARDKADRNLQQRYEALIKGDQARIEGAKLNQKAALNELELTKEIIGKKGIEITAQTDLNALFKDDLATKKLSYEQFELIAKSQKRLLDAQKEEFEGTRRIQALRSSLIEEQIKLIQDQAKEERDAQVKLAEELIKTDQAKNARILANQGATLEDKINAERGNLHDLDSLNDKQTADELFALREKGLQEIILDKKTNDEINAQAGNNLKLRAQLIIDAKNKEFDANARFQNEVALLQEAGRLHEEEIVKKSSENILKLLIDRSKQISEVNNSELNISKDDALVNLNRSLANREISIIEYERRKKQIELAASADALELQNGELRHQIIILSATETLEKQNAQTILKLKEQIAKNEVDISDKKTEKLKANLKEAYNLEKQLANSIVDTVSTLTKNETDSKVQALEDQLNALQENENKQLELAGNNEAAKAQIQKRFAAEQAAIKKEEAKLKHDEAEKEKRLAEAKIIINTAIAISEHLYNPIAVALITTLGALELVKVESTPIPGYFKGAARGEHPGGLAYVGERGSELIATPSGGLHISPAKSTLIDLPQGSEVFTSPETMKMLAMAGMSQAVTERVATNGYSGELITKIDKLTEVTKKNKPHSTNYTRVGAMVYVAMGEKGKYMKRIRGLSMGKWLD